jgi:hypothetical protein
MSRSVLRNYGPENHGYRAKDTRAELIAEAVRAYMADPNYLKTVAPMTARTIRAAVNAHPRLSKIIQLNSLLGGGLALGGLGGLGGYGGAGGLGSPPAPNP